MAAGSGAGRRRGYQRDLAEAISIVEELIRDLQERLRHNNNDKIKGHSRDYLLSVYSNIKELLDRGPDSLSMRIARETLGSRSRPELDSLNNVLSTKDELTPLRGVLTALRNLQQPRHDRAPRRQPEGGAVSSVSHVIPWSEGGPSGPKRRQYRGDLKAPVPSQVR